jgi:hypothetical protein
LSSVELKVNVINQLKLLRQSTFKDPLSFLDEDIQNAQRAKATEVKVTTDYCDKKVMIENNGAILNNPQALFSIAESEWDEEVQRTESPFGMGFFSNITVSNYIEVFSGNKHIIFNVDDMIQNNKTEIEVLETEVSYDGFKLVLNNFDFSQVSSSKIKERVELLGRYIHELNIYYNNELQPKMDLTEGDSSIFIKRFENEETFKGWIALSQGFISDLKIFYKGRLVTKLDDMYYVKGDIHVSDKTLNLTSPDRKDIIRDEKYYDFIKTLRLHIADLANESFINGKQSDIEKHIDSISNYASKNELKAQMTFLVFDTTEENDSKYLQGIALAKRENQNIKTLNDYEVFVRSEAAKQSISHLNEVEIVEQVKNVAPEARGVRHIHGSDSYSRGYTEKPEIDEDKLDERKGQELRIDETPLFWLGFNEIVEQEAKFNIAQHYGLKIIVSRNKFEDSVLELLGKEQNIIHISQLTEKTEIYGVLSNTTLTRNEQRAMMLLDMISRVVGFNENVFTIGDLMVIKRTSVEVINRDIETIEEKYIAMYDSKNNKIMLDRTSIDKSKLRDDLEENLDVSDYKFLLINMKQIVDQLGLVKGIPSKNSGELYQMIINTLAVA